MVDSLVVVPAGSVVGRTSPQLPVMVSDAGAAAQFAWDEFFSAHLRNRHTRAAYTHAARRFFAWLEPKRVRLEQITPGLVGEYFTDHPGSIPTRKLHLAALRALFDIMVTRHVLVLNPAHSVRGERYQIVEGKTPEITVEQARTLIASIRLTSAVAFRDRAMIAMLFYTAARAGAVAKLRLKHFRFDGSQYTLRFDEKGGKSREIPVRGDLQQMLIDYLDAGNIARGEGDLPLFRTAVRRSGCLSAKPMSNIDLCRMVKRRLNDAGLPSTLSPHSFRVAAITDLLTRGESLEDVQHLAGHADPRTTRLYDRRQKRITRNLVERISNLTDVYRPLTK